MRHRMAHRKLGRTSSHRRALFRNQLASLIEHERIVTTLPKAKELRPLADKMITLGKKGTLHARRHAARLVSDDALLRKLFDDIASRFEDRPGGYTRIIKLGARRGDNAEMAILEFVDFEFGAEASAAPEPAKTRSKAKPEEAEESPESDGDEEEEAKPAKKAAKKAPAKKAAKKAPAKKAAKKAPAKKAAKKKAE